MPGPGPDDADHPANAGGIDTSVEDHDLPHAQVVVDGKVPAAPPRRKRAPTFTGMVVDKLEGVAESLKLPVPKTRKSRVLVRSVIVAFLVIAAWIVGLVWWQLRGASKPDLRPIAEQILDEIRAGDYEKLYREASPRFQEITIEGDFARKMADMNATLGPFREIKAVTGTEQVRGPGGKSARVALVMSFARADTVRGSISFHWDDGQWKLLGVSIDLPDSIAKVETSEDKRLERIKGDPQVIVDALVVLLRLQKGDFAGVWRDAADKPFKTAISIADLGDLEKQRQKELGRFKRIYDVTSNTITPGGTGDSLDLLLEYEGAEGAIIKCELEFSRADPQIPVWRLASYKPIMPSPRVPAKPAK